MNPFSKFLRQWAHNPSLNEFADYWDRLEAVVVGVYRQKMTLTVAQAEFEQVWPWLRANYGAWEAALRPLWRQATAGGQPTQTDPFQLLLAFTEPEDIGDNWTAMQHLPAAREALNQLFFDASFP
jgi:hypothetical protein